MLDLILPTTDLGVLVQLVVVAVVGFPSAWVLKRRGQSDLAWLIFGLTVSLIGFFAFRTTHFGIE